MRNSSASNTSGVPCLKDANTSGVPCLKDANLSGVPRLRSKFKCSPVA